MLTNRNLPRDFPESLQGLVDLALDLRWSWNHGADDLWRMIDSELWDSSGDPWLLLVTVADERLATLAGDPRFLARLADRLAERDAHRNSPGWFSERYAERRDDNVAYFCMEFGLSDALPVFAGGLGVLAGDLLKTACDLDVPVVGIGLLYQQGYFRQAISAQGEQIEFFPYNDPGLLPVMPLRDAEGEWIRVTVELPGRDVRLRAWHCVVGRRTLMLLDSNDPGNAPGDRGITSELYGGGPELRLQQEIVLGSGGWRLLERLGIRCPVCHLNEGHAAFAVLERALHYMERVGCSFQVALRATRAGNLFTTHTPMPSGFDVYPADLMRQYFARFAERAGIATEKLLELGRAETAGPDEPFNLAFFAVRGAGAVNAVSRAHGHVSREIFQPLFPRWPQSEVPVGHVTNGVHVPSWDSAAADKLWTHACGKPRWRGTTESLECEIRALDDESLWTLRQAGRLRLVEFLAERLYRQYRRRGAGSADAPGRVRLDPDVLTIGFARRFAEYKRMNLLLQQPERLVSLLTDRQMPVQLVLAGKAHPRDVIGKRQIRQWQDFLRSAGVEDRVLFIEDYDMTVAGELVQGADVWLTTPRNPSEACGTSGMKVLVNGGLNLSQVEGWWAEACSQNAGWALGDGATHESVAAQDSNDADQLFSLLETEVVPSFYARDAQGLPRAWIHRMRESMAGLTARFSSNRMLREYVERYYLPLADEFARRDVAAATELSHWYERLKSNWGKIHFGNLTVRPGEAGHMFEIHVYLYALEAEAVRVELYADALPGGQAECLALERRGPLSGAVNAYCFAGAVRTGRPASDYTPRIVPAHAAARIPLEAEMILWYR